MEQYLLFIAISSATIASPGPGIILTITNAFRFGFWGALSGILGIAMGMLFIALFSVTSLALILKSSAQAFTVLKYIGAAYLIYIGIKMWRSTSKLEFNGESDYENSHSFRFVKGLLLTLLNPKPIIFFMALFPQFLVVTESFIKQFVIFAFTFGGLVLAIHCLYALIAMLTKSKVSAQADYQLINKVAGSFYLLFGAALAFSKKST